MKKINYLKKNAIFIISGLVILFFFLIRIYALLASSPVGFDESAEGYIVQEMINGKVIYKNLFDHKSPLTHYPVILIFYLFGSSGFSLHLLGFIYDVLLLLLLFFIGKKFIGKNYAMIGCAIAAVFLFRSDLTGESPMTLFGLVGFYFYYIYLSNKKIINFFYSGIFTGISIWFKQTGVLFFFILLAHQIFLKYQKKNTELLKNILMLSLGILIISLPLLSYFIVHAGFYSFFYYIFIFNLKFSGSVSRIFIVGKFLLLALGLFGLLVPLICYNWENKKKEIHSLLLIYFIIFVLFFILSQEVFSQHLIQIVPFFSLFVAASLRFVKKREINKIFSILLILFFMSSMLSFLNEFVRQDFDQKTIITEIKNIIPEKSEIFSDNPIYLFLGGYLTNYKTFLLAPSVASVFDFSDFCDYIKSIDFLILTHRKKYLNEYNLKCVTDNFEIIKKFDDVGESYVEVWKKIN